MTTWSGPQIREALRWRDGGDCALCGVSLCFEPRQSGRSAAMHEATIDHILPQCAKGGHEPSNLRLCCYECNRARGHDGHRVPLAPQPRNRRYRFEVDGRWCWVPAKRGGQPTQEVGWQDGSRDTVPTASIRNRKTGRSLT